MNVGFFAARVAIGAMLLFSGWSKLTAPHEEFLAAILLYDVARGFAAELAARTLPWAEVLIGLFLVVGHRVRLAAAGAAGLFGLFLTVVGQALVRRLDIGECGCFGGAIHLPPWVIFVNDAVCLALLAAMLRRPDLARFGSLDAWQARAAS